MQPEIAALSATLQEHEAASFGGLYVSHAPTFSIVIQFTRDEDAIYAAYLGGTDLVGYTRTQRVAYSLNELAAARDEVTAKTGLPASVNVVTNRVEVEVLPTQASPQVTALPNSAVLKRVDVPRTPVTSAYGGLALSGGTCTSGFTVYYGSNTSNRGITTAGHCPNSLTLSGLSLSYQNDELRSGNYDVQTHKLSGATYPNWAYDGLNDSDPYYRPITSKNLWVSQYVGEFVCKYGSTTHYGCGYIVSLTDQGCVGGSPYGYYVKVDSDPNGTGYDLAEGGDSGGPWYANTTAMGTMSCQQGYDAIYSTVGFVEHGVMSILTTP